MNKGILVAIVAVALGSAVLIDIIKIYQYDANTVPLDAPAAA